MNSFLFLLNWHSFLRISSGVTNSFLIVYLFPHHYNHNIPVLLLFFLYHSLSVSISFDPPLSLWYSSYFLSSPYTFLFLSPSMPSLFLSIAPYLLPFPLPSLPLRCCRCAKETFRCYRRRVQGLFKDLSHWGHAFKSKYVSNSGRKKWTEFEWAIERGRFSQRGRKMMW